jgi:hypothetical protein
VIVRSPLLKRTAFALGAGRFFVTTGESFRALSFDREGHVVDTLESPRPRTALSPEVADALGIQGPKADILPDSLAATTDVLIDPDGRVWLGRADAVPVDPGPWVVSAADGTIIARVRMPDGFRPTAIGEATVLGVWTDDLGVESLRLYRLPVPRE